MSLFLLSGKLLVVFMMTAATKTFNIAGCHTGNVIIADDALRARFASRMMTLGISPNAFGLHMVEAAYSPEGAAWVDGLNTYLDGNRRLFEEGITHLRTAGAALTVVDARVQQLVEAADGSLSVVELSV